MIKFEVITVSTSNLYSYRFSVPFILTSDYVNAIRLELHLVITHNPLQNAIFLCIHLFISMLLFLHTIRRNKHFTQSNNSTFTTIYNYVLVCTNNPWLEHEGIKRSIYS